ncbi:MAG: porphobilinogen synthase [Chthonomonadaceae bacterium]|nr:porphobilinogen synthase [Chthonomonadaceae bacterium]
MIYINRTQRPRRLRESPLLRKMVRETRVTKDNLLYPMFVSESGSSTEISSMPGIFRYSLDDLKREVTKVAGLGIPAIMLFGIPNEKDEVGSGGYDTEGIIPRAIRALKAEIGDSVLIVPDVCLCEYTSHGHCGVISNGTVDNDETVPLLARAAVAYAEAGADMIAPSDMMDGRIGVIREELDAAGFPYTPIMAYSAKYSSGFYGPFREAAGSTPQFGDRKAYQMDPPNAREALKEMDLDLAEGADILMVKPGLAYLDILRAARERYDVPLAIYNVSGEYSMVKAAAQNGWIDEGRVVSETLTAFKRAGADIILTYHAVDAVREGWVE